MGRGKVAQAGETAERSIQDRSCLGCMEQELAQHAERALRAGAGRSALLSRAGGGCGERVSPVNFLLCDLPPLAPVLLPSCPTYHRESLMSESVLHLFFP